MGRPRKGYCFTRQEAGNIIFKYIDEHSGKWRSKRVPPDIVSMAQAVEWIRVNFYHAEPEPVGEPVPERVARLRALIRGTDNLNEKRAAQLALEKLGYEDSGDE